MQLLQYYYMACNRLNDNSSPTSVATLSRHIVASHLVTHKQRLLGMVVVVLPDPLRVGARRNSEEYCTSVSPPHCGGAVPAILPSGRPKWWGKFPEKFDHPVAPNFL